MKRSVLLTIDDAPSSFMKEKVDFLLAKKIPAIFFCRGEYFDLGMEAVVYAIRNGFLVGNHSFSHPYFSKMSSFDVCVDEIMKTERYIEKAYFLAGVPRDFKTVRLPFGDLGGRYLELLNEFFRANNFKCLSVPGYAFSYSVPWSFDSLDYKKACSLQQLLHHLNEYFRQSDKVVEIAMFHDFDRSHLMFQPLVEALCLLELEFYRVIK
jgi:peptidoglycan/xylan/chitin deacetylase (PgdA/CDA1 family)